MAFDAGSVTQAGAGVEFRDPFAVENRPSEYRLRHWKPCPLRGILCLVDDRCKAGRPLPHEGMFAEADRMRRVTRRRRWGGCDRADAAPPVAREPLIIVHGGKVRDGSGERQDGRGA